MSKFIPVVEAANQHEVDWLNIDQIVGVKQHGSGAKVYMSTGTWFTIDLPHYSTLLAWLGLNEEPSGAAST